MIDAKTLRDGTIAAWRYLAFLEAERRQLLHELMPEFREGDPVFIPCDRFVIETGGSPLDRAGPVLKAAGIDPHAHDAWVEFIGADFTNLPTIGDAE